VTDQSESAASLGGLDLARAWADVPPEHLEVALKALEPQLVRDQKYRMLRLEIQRELSLRHIENEESRAKRTHALYLVGLIAGFAISVGMLVGAVIVGSNGQPWLAAMLSGPSVLALATVFVLRRSDTAQSRAVARAQSLALNSAVQASSPPSNPNTGAV
jgi:hypothetical protein